MNSPESGFVLIQAALRALLSVIDEDDLSADDLQDLSDRVNRLQAAVDQEGYAHGTDA